MAGALETIVKQSKVPSNWALVILVAAMPFIKSGMVSWAGDELEPIIIAQVEVAVDSLNIKQAELNISQEEFAVEQQAQKAQIGSIKVWIVDLKETVVADTVNDISKEDFKSWFREVLEENP